MALREKTSPPGSSMPAPAGPGQTAEPPTLPTPTPAAALAPGTSTAGGASANPPAPAAPTASMPLAAAIAAWCELLRQEKDTENPVKAFGSDLRQLAGRLGATKPLGQVTTRELNDWLRWQRDVKQCSPKTYARRITSVKAFFRWLTDAAALASDPAAPLIQQTVLSSLPDILTEPEVTALLASAEALRWAEAPDPRPYVLFTLLLQTGIKKGECLALAPNDVDFSDPDEPLLWVRYPNPRDRFKERKPWLEPGWVPAYRAFLAQYAPGDKLFPCSPRRLEYMLEEIGHLAGQTKRLSFDMCRWTCAVREVRAGTDFDKIRQKLGLSKIQWREISMKLRKLTAPAL